jgi:hypothetical protein
VGRRGLAIACALALAGCGSHGSGSEPSTAAAAGRAGAVAAARSYVDDLNRRDGAAICAAWTSDMRRWMQGQVGLLLRTRSCPEYATHLIGDRQGWTHASILAVGPVNVAGDRASVTLVERHFRKRSDKTITDLVQLADEDGQWKVAKPGKVFYQAIGIAGPSSTPDPPGTQSIVDANSRIRPPGFECGRSAKATQDPAGDQIYHAGFGALPYPAATTWVDVRKVEVSAAGGDTCFAIELAAPPRPDSSFALTFHFPSARRPGSFAMRRVEFRIDGLDRPHGLARAGVAGNHVFLLIPREMAPPGPLLTWALLASSTQDDDPGLQHPVPGQDTVPDS